MKLFTIPLLSQTFVSGLQWKSYEKQQQKKTSGIKFVKPSSCNKSCEVIIEILSLLLWETLQTTPLGFINNNWKTRIIK